MPRHALARKFEVTDEHGVHRRKYSLCFRVGSVGQGVAVSKGVGARRVCPGRGRGEGRYIPQASGADSLLEEAGLKLLVPLRGLVPIALSKMTGKLCGSRLGTSTG